MAFSVSYELNSDDDVEQKTLGHPAVSPYPNAFILIAEIMLNFNMKLVMSAHIYTCSILMYKFIFHTYCRVCLCYVIFADDRFLSV